MYVEVYKDAEAKSQQYNFLSDSMMINDDGDGFLMCKGAVNRRGAIKERNLRTHFLATYLNDT